MVLSVTIQHSESLNLNLILPVSVCHSALSSEFNRSRLC